MPRQTTNNASTEPGYRKQFLLALAGIVVFIAVFANHNSSPNTTRSTGQTTDSSTFDKNAESLTNPASIWVLVNKKHPLDPLSYTPDLTNPAVALKPGRRAEELQISKVVAKPLDDMFTAASTAGRHLMLSSGYRSYTYQIRVYNSIVSTKGQSAADEESARPGYSEHQTGLAVDVAPLNGRCELHQCFESTSEGQWVATNAYKYGFIVRYPKDKQTVTGYEYEPWHLRYVGQELAGEMHKQHITTLEEFFDISGGGYAH